MIDDPGSRLSAALHAFHFLRPAWLAALPLLWLAVAWAARRREREGDWGGLIDAELLDGLRLGGSEGAARTRYGRPWPWLAAAWTLAALALAGPSWQRDQAPGFRSGANWVLVLDLSPSMAVTDLAPDRVTRARYAIEDLLAQAHDAHVGLVVFSDEAYTVTPLTDDVQTVRALLDPLAPGILPTAGDHLAAGLAQARQLLERAGGLRGARIVVLSDGFDDPAAALQAAAALQQAGARVDLVGIGTAAGAPLPDPNGGFVTGAQGRPVLARLDPDPMQRVAAAGGGRYFELGALPTLIDSLTRTPVPGGTSEHDAGEVARWRDGGAWLLLPLLLLAALLARRSWL
ncbi:MAG: VWA domain-containing protein [Burkholderiales bacterium]|nr:VWA domain-containing protein [Burkholderiales bacterium]MDE1929635.1 VWA domain-containing protein [Burkholderiales bacterium]MDE2502109.1 VWA domain-containing protein [Burkholderiales bacterium]